MKVILSTTLESKSLSCCPSVYPRKIPAFVLNGVPDSNSDKDIVKQPPPPSPLANTYTYLYLYFVVESPFSVPAPLDSSFAGNRARFRTRSIPFFSSFCHSKDENSTLQKHSLISNYSVCCVWCLRYFIIIFIVYCDLTFIFICFGSNQPP